METTDFIAKQEDLKAPEVVSGDILYFVTIVCNEMALPGGTKIKCDNYLPVYNTLEEAQDACRKKGGGQILGLANPA